MNADGLVLTIVLVGDINKPHECDIVLVRDHSKQEPLCWKFPGGKTEGKDTAYAVRHELADETGLEYDCAAFDHHVVGKTTAADGYMVTFYALRFTKEYAYQHLQDWGDEPTLEVAHFPLTQLRDTPDMLLEQHKKWLAASSRAWLGKIFMWYAQN